MRGWILVLAALAAGCAAPGPSVDAGGARVGVVVLHGKWGNPYDSSLAFTRAMQRAGFLVDSPEMPWSARRSYDTGVEGAMKEIDAAVARLRSRGAQKTFVAGHSLGAAGAVRYASQRRVDGIIALAPGHYPEGSFFVRITAESMKKAKAMRPDESGWFDDPNNGGRMKPMHMDAGVYVDYFDPAGPMNFRNNAAALRPGTAVLWVVGAAEEPGLKRAAQVTFEALPASLQAKFVEVPGGHFDTPSNSASLCVAWIREVAAK
jgi:pimeloyl-ACP methyl ester carboxylesterase